ncbi:MAG: ABC transporter permease [Bacillota bacterium]|nr:ABC transporter permease [Bacillota bacterium]
MDMNYLASIINSTLRSTTPVLFAALGSGICSKVGIFNIALEGQMLIASFVAIVVNYFTHSVFLSILAGMIAGSVVGLVVAILQVKYKAADMVIGTSINLLVGGLTAIFLYIILGVKGSFSSHELISLTKINLPIIKDIPFIGRIFENLTILDYSSYLIAFLIYVYLYKTVRGFRTLSVGINMQAADSLGINSLRTQMLMVIISGALCGLGGVSLSLGQVTLFTENMTAGRGFIAMAAASMAQNHPIFSIASSLFFGACQAFGVAIQNTIPSQLTMAIPYIATIVALAIFGNRNRRKAG